MPARFMVLASGSSGNASILDINGRGVLVDIGIGPRRLIRELEEVRIPWNRIKAVLLTHIHSDHIKEPNLNLLAKTGVPLWCHADHAMELDRVSSGFRKLRAAGLVHFYRAGEPISLGEAVVMPLPVWHDVPTFAFRFDAVDESWAMGYAADLGCWAGDLAQRFADVDVLALEFNHDVEMERTSRRDRRLIERVLGDAGHLSNVQASRLLAEILRQTSPGRLRHVVPLHLSRECNHPDLVREALASVRLQHQVDFAHHLAHHEKRTPWFPLTAPAPALVQLELF